MLHLLPGKAKKEYKLSIMLLVVSLAGKNAAPTSLSICCWWFLLQGRMLHLLPCLYVVGGFSCREECCTYFPARQRRNTSCL